MYENQLLSRREAAAFLGLNEGTLAVWATTQRYDLPYVKVGRSVRYRMSDLEGFIERNINKHGEMEAHDESAH